MLHSVQPTSLTRGAKGFGKAFEHDIGPRLIIRCQDSGSARAFHGCARISADHVHKALAPFSSQSGTGRTRGSDGSNPASSSEESANFHSLEPEALTDPARQALRSTRLVDLFIALRTASDECNP